MVKGRRRAPESVRRSREIWGRTTDVSTIPSLIWTDLWSRHGLTTSVSDQALAERYMESSDEILQLVSSSELAPLPLPYGSAWHRGLATGPADGYGSGWEGGPGGDGETADREGHAVGQDDHDPWTAEWYPRCPHGNQEGLRYDAMPNPMLTRKNSALEWVCGKGERYDITAEPDPRIAQSIGDLDEYVERSRKFRERNPLCNRLSKQVCQGSRRGSTIFKFPRVASSGGGESITPRNQIRSQEIGWGLPKILEGGEREEDGLIPTHHWGSGDIFGLSVGLAEGNFDPLLNGLDCFGDKQGAPLIISDVADRSSKLGLGEQSELMNRIQKAVDAGQRVIYKCHLADASHPIVHKARYHNMEVVCDTGVPKGKGCNPILLIMKANHTRNMFHKGWIQEFYDAADMQLSQECWKCVWETSNMHLKLPELELKQEHWTYKPRLASGWVKDPPELLEDLITLGHMRTQRQAVTALARMKLRTKSMDELKMLLEDYTAKEIAGELTYQIMENRL